jgi:hypothetical protein
MEIFGRKRRCRVNTLKRYGIEWTGPKTPIAVPMKDGHWTPWHLAQERIAELEDKLKMASLLCKPESLRIHNIEQQAKGIIFIRQKTYNKDAELLIEHGLNGSDCKRISAWLDYELQQLRDKGGAE